MNASTLKQKLKKNKIARIGAKVLLPNPYPKYYEKLDKYISENNYEIIDDSIEIQLVDPSLITCKSEMVSEIQIPVRRRLYD